MAATKKQQKAFLDMIIPIAQRQAKKHNNQIFASVCIAQACWESGWGTSAKMVKANAVFGVKVGKSAWKFGTAWKGAAYYSGTTEYYDGVNPSHIMDFFRQYSSVEDSTEDYFDMLCHCQRYKPALNKSNPADCIRAIVAGGYATGPKYAEKIIGIIKSHNLAWYDTNTYTPTALTTQTGNAAPAGYQIGKIYTLQSDMYVRKSPAGEHIDFEELTADGQKNGFADKDGYAILKKGTKVTCREARGKWIRIPSGWVCAYSDTKIYIK